MHDLFQLTASYTKQILHIHNNYILHLLRWLLGSSINDTEMDYGLSKLPRLLCVFTWLDGALAESKPTGQSLDTFQVLWSYTTAVLGPFSISCWVTNFAPWLTLGKLQSDALLVTTIDFTRISTYAAHTHTLHISQLVSLTSEFNSFTS